MAEITKITTPMMPKENTTIKHKPVTDQAFSLTDPSKVHKSDNEGKTSDRQSDTATLLRDNMGRPAIMSLLKNPGEMMQAFKKIAFLIEMGVSASDAAKDEATRELLESLFLSPGEVKEALLEQDKSSVLFKGEAFDILRDIMNKFEDFPRVKDSVVNLLKIFDQNVNAQNSIKTILNNCNNLLDYMFSNDKSQFSGYIQSLAQMLLPADEAAEFIGKMAVIPEPQQQADGQAQTNQPQNTSGQPQANQPGDIPGQTQANQPGVPEQPQANQSQGTEQQAAAQKSLPEQAQNTQTQTPQAAINDAAQAQNSQQTQGQEINDPLNKDLHMQKFGQELQQSSAGAAEQTKTNDQVMQLSQKEAAQILKNNLLPLLGEIVVKYNQSEKIRDTVMVAVHNMVRVDRGTPEALESAVRKLASELRDVANLPKSFEKQFLEAINQSVKDVKAAPNNVIDKMSDIVSEALHSPTTNPAVLRQAENMLISMLQNQSSIMDILHFVIPFQTPMGQVFTELYVDPETEESVGRQKGKSNKIFLSVESEAHGSFELSFLETGEHVDFAMWAPEDLVPSLSGLKRNFADIMQLYGYTMNSFKVDEMRAPHSVAEVFPRLVEKKVGIDVHA